MTGKIIEPMKPEPITAADSFWVLQKPGTDQTVMATHPKEGKPLGPITFASEEKALEFKEQYDIPDEFMPVFVPALQ